MRAVRELIVAEHGDARGVAARRGNVIVTANIANFIGTIVELIAAERELRTQLKS